VRPPRADGLIFLPLFLRPPTMSFHGGAVDQNLRGRSAGLRQSLDKFVHTPFSADEAIVECLPRTVISRRVDPATAGLQNMHDPADHAPVVDARFASCVVRQMQLDLRKLRFCQPKFLDLSPPPFSLEAVNHDRLSMPTPYWSRPLIQGEIEKRCAGRPRAAPNSAPLCDPRLSMMTTWRT
jgi:hypothetical protein